MSTFLEKRSKIESSKVQNSKVESPKIESPEPTKIELTRKRAISNNTNQRTRNKRRNLKTKDEDNVIERINNLITTNTNVAIEVVKENQVESAESHVMVKESESVNISIESPVASIEKHDNTATKDTENVQIIYNIEECFNYENNNFVKFFEGLLNTTKNELDKLVENEACEKDINTAKQFYSILLKFGSINDFLNGNTYDSPKYFWELSQMFLQLCVDMDTKNFFALSKYMEDTNKK